MECTTLWSSKLSITGVQIKAEWTPVKKGTLALGRSLLLPTNMVLFCFDLVLLYYLWDFFFFLFNKIIFIYFHSRKSNKKVIKLSHPLIHTISTHKVIHVLTVLYFHIFFHSHTYTGILLSWTSLLFVFLNKVILYTFCILLFVLDMNILSIVLTQKQLTLCVYKQFIQPFSVKSPSGWFQFFYNYKQYCNKDSRCLHFHTKTFTSAE